MSRPHGPILTPLAVDKRALLRTFNSPTALEYQLMSHVMSVSAWNLSIFSSLLALVSKPWPTPELYLKSTHSKL